MCDHGKTDALVSSEDTDKPIAIFVMYSIIPFQQPNSQSCKEVLTGFYHINYISKSINTTMLNVKVKLYLRSKSTNI